MADRTPTPEQQRARDLFATGKGLVVEAGAGTGKTTTLGMMARDTPRTGTYMAFNRETAADAGRAMPQTVDCRTINSLAFQAILRNHPQGRALLDRLPLPRVAPYKAARHLGLGALIVQVPLPFEGGRQDYRQKVLQPNWQAGYVMRGITSFCQSADPEPAAKHFPYVPGIDPPGVGGRRTYVNNRLVAAEMEPYLHKAWADLTSPTGVLRFSHDVYVKLWQLGTYPIPGSFLLFDEAQDASPVMLAALAAQTDRQVIYVGDSQQQIYEWRGAVNALDLLDPGTPRAWLTQSWRFGPAVAEVANLALDQIGSAQLRLTGTPSIRSTVHLNRSFARPRAVLCRSNAAAVQAVLNFQERGMAPHLVGGCDDIVWFAQAAGALQAGERTSHPELACFDSWREVLAYVDDDPQGGELRMLVNLVDSYGPDIVIEALTGLMTQNEADVIVSTAHRAKGREWPSVRLASDFEPPVPGDGGDGEWRLLYVAATRAINDLDLSTCMPLRDLLL